jgi:hypothetical protein
MRKYLGIFLLLFLFATPALAQRTIVTGTVTDLNGLAWAGGSIQATLTLPVGASGATLNGVQISGTTQRTALDSTGSFLMQLPDNAVVQPGGTQWIFTANISPGIPPPAGTGPQSCNATLTITGVSQNISASFSACPKLSNTAGGVGGTLTPGFIPKAATSTTLTNSLCDEGITSANILTCTDTGGETVPSLQTSGVGAGFWRCSNGNGTQPAAPAGFFEIVCPTGAVTAYAVAPPTVAPVNNNSAWLMSNANPSVGAFSKMPQTGMVTAQQAGLTAVTNLPGLSFAVEANTRYVLSCTLYYQVSATTANLSIAITGPASPTFVSYSLFDGDTATQIGANLVATAFASTLSGSGTSTATTNFPATVTMGLSNGANAGTVQVQAGAAGTGNSTIQTGSFCQLQ